MTDEVLKDESFFARARRSPSFSVGAALVALVVLAAALSLVWTPYPPAAIDVRHRLLEPSAAHWLGTDSLGHDIVSQLLAGADISILVGVIAVGIGLVALGLLAASARRPLEALIMNLCDFTFAFPALLLAIILTAALGAGIVNAILAIGVANVPIFVRLTRAVGQGVLVRDYVLAARAAGKGPIAIALEHVLPNVAPALIVQATIQFAIAILAEAALSYLGLGAQPPETSWGRMLSEAQQQMFVAPRLAVFPGLAVAFAVFGLNLLGDGLRDLLDPRLRARR
jgi:peptide/nickel transport system permease protein